MNRPGAYMSERRITISPKVDRKIYFRFKDLCNAHGNARPLTYFVLQSTLYHALNRSI